MAESNYIGQQVQGYTITKKLGGGGYGTVYLGVKEDLGKQYLTAIKHISMPDAEAYDAVLQDYGYNKTAAQMHFEKLIEGIASEINTLLGLSKKDNRFIVAYYDHDIKKSTDPFRADIFMRMEYLTPLPKYFRQNGFTLGATVKLGLNMCDALTLCHNSEVMHRDIKEANIFVSENGAYKLGDFGVAKVALETTQAGSIKGTASYMAPEVYFREPYDKSVDIYSLGIVLYKLLNNQRLPFMPDAPAAFTADDKNNAEARRLKGETPPLPFHAKNRLGEVVVKACSAKAQRYTSAEAFKKDLAECLKTMSVEDYDAVIVPPAADGGESSDSYSENSQNSYTQTQGATVTMGAQGNSYNSVPPQQQNPYTEKKKTKRKTKTILIVAAVVVVVGGGFFAYQHFFNNPVRDFGNFLRAENYSSAKRLFSSTIQDNGRQAGQAAELVGNQAETVANRYVQETLSYDAALNALQELSRLGIVEEEEIKPYIDETNELHLSRTAYSDAQEYVTAGRFSDAILELRKVIERDAKYTQAQEQLVTMIASYKESVFQEADAAESGKAFAEATELITEALKIIENDADLSVRLDKIADAHANDMIAEAKTFVAQEYFEDALVLINDGLLLYPDNAGLLQQLAAVEKADVSFQIRQARAAAAEPGNYDQSISLLQAAQKRYPENTELASEVEVLQNSDVAAEILAIDERVAAGDLEGAIVSATALSKKYPTNSTAQDKFTEVQNLDIGAVAAEAEKLVDEHKFTAAHELLGTLLGKYPNNAEVKGLIAALEDGMYPDLPLENAVNISDAFTKLSSAFDNYNNPYGKAVRLRDYYNVYADDTGRTCQILLDGKYAKFKGTFFVELDTENYKYSRTFRIELDGKVIYRPTNLGKSTRPIYVDLSVADGNDFRIIVTSTGSNSPHICVGDAGFFE